MSRRSVISYILAERPEGEIIPSKAFRRRTILAPTSDDLQDGQVLVQTLYYSLDPGARTWMDERHIVSPLPIGEVMFGYVLARVLASKSRKAQVGDIVIAYTGWQEIAIANENKFIVSDPLPPGGRITDLLGLLGPTGLAAHVGLSKFGDLKMGNTIVISGAAGATGSIVGQIAKIRGAGRVIGTTSSDAKCKWLTEVARFDIALNYHDPDFERKFEEATPNFIDVYWDNFGASMLDLALSRAARYARFIECGMISSYNSTREYTYTNLLQIVFKNIRMQGFTYRNYPNDIIEAKKELREWLRDGKISRPEHIVKGTIDDLEACWRDLFAGKNIGKVLLDVQVNF